MFSVKTVLTIGHGSEDGWGGEVAGAGVRDFRAPPSRRVSQELEGEFHKVPTSNITRP